MLFSSIMDQVFKVGQGLYVVVTDEHWRHSECVCVCVCVCECVWVCVCVQLYLARACTYMNKWMKASASQQ